MKNNNKFGGVAQKIISTVFFIATFACLLYFFFTVKYLPFFLAAIVVAMPLAVNILLHLLHQHHHKNVKCYHKSLLLFVLLQSRKNNLNLN